MRRIRLNLGLRVEVCTDLIMNIIRYLVLEYLETLTII